MSTYLVLLRGINVSGANIVKMADFRAFLTGLGFGRSLAFRLHRAAYFLAFLK